MKGRIIVNNWKEPIKFNNKRPLYKKPPKTFWEKMDSIINLILN